MATQIKVNAPDDSTKFSDLKIGDVFYLECNKAKNTCVKVSSGSRFSYCKGDIVPTSQDERVVVARSIQVNY